MSSPRRVLRMGLPLLIGWLGISSAVPAAPSLGVDPPPNILIIVTDDQRATEGTLKVMPRLREWFGKGGVRYPNAFATTPLCCPARATIFSGLYAHNHGVFTNQGGLEFDQRYTIQRYLDDAGYKTALVGKYFNNWPLTKDPPHFDKWALFAGGYYGHDYNVNGAIKHVPAYSTNYIKRKATDFLERFENSDDSDPWLLYIATYAPHALFIPEDKYVRKEVPRWNGNPAVFESDRADKPRYVQIRDESYETWKKNRRKQLRTLFSVDDLVAGLAGGLGRMDESRSTLAFYLSDNGYMWADHGLYDKGAPYTPSIQIPMFARWPGRLGPDVADRRLVGNVDIAATVLDAADLDPAPGHPLDGRSLLDGTWDRDRMLTEYRNSGNIWTPPTWGSLRTRSLQYTEYFDQDGNPEFREYYDLKSDPWQLRNLLRDGDRSNNPPRSELTALSAQLTSDRNCKANACP